MEQDKLKNCPFCNEPIQTAALKCRYCGEWLQPKPLPESLAAQQTAPKNADPAVVEVSQSGFTASALLTPNRMKWVSIGLLFLSFGVICFVLKDTNLNTPNVVERLTAIIGRILICAGIFGWIAWSGSGKRKGYGFFTFSLVCAAMTFITTHNFRVDVEKRKHNHEGSNHQIAASLHDFVHQATNEGTVQLKSTGDASLDTAMQPLVELLNDFRAALGNMETAIEELKQVDVFSPIVATNRTTIESELRKRDASQAIIEQHQQTFPFMIESARKKYGSLNIPDDVRKGALTGFENSMKAQLPAVNTMFSLRFLREKADSDLLHFLSKEFSSYKYITNLITFEVSAKQEEYSRLHTAVVTIIKEAEAFQRRQVEATEAAKTQINKIAE